MLIGFWFVGESILQHMNGLGLVDTYESCDGKRVNRQMAVRSCQQQQQRALSHTDRQQLGLCTVSDRAYSIRFTQL